MANVKITDMTAKSTALDGTELFEIVDDPSGTPVTRKITLDQIISAVNLPSIRTIDVTLTGDIENDRKIVTGDRGNIVTFSGSCASVSVYIHSDVLAVNGFRTTVVIPQGTDDDNANGYVFTIYYDDGVTPVAIWKILSEDVEAARSLSYDILVVGSEITVVGQTDSDTTN